MGASLGPVDDAEKIQFAVCLNLDVAGLQTFVNQVSNPNSPSYRHFLSPAQVAQRFGASPADVQATVSFLEASGFKVTSVGKSNYAIFAEGTAAQVQKAFQTNLVRIQRVDDGTIFRTNTTAVHMPAPLASKISTVYGLDTSRKMIRRANTTTLNPTLYRPAYNAAGFYTAGYYGQGRNIAVANWDGFRLNNLTKFYPAYSLPTPSGGIESNVTVKVVGGGTGYGSGTPAGEGDLDIQNVLQSAPLCNLYVYDDNTSDSAAPLSTYDKIASDNIADIVTESYGWGSYYYSYNRSTRKGTQTYYGSACTADHNEHLILSAQGITYMAATGDSGTNNFNHVTSGTTSAYAYCYPDMDPEVLMVGGSEVTVNSSTGARVSEVPWGLSAGTGGTGGFDYYDSPANGFAFNVAPSYQTTYISSFTSKYNYRLVPDVVSQAGGQNGLGGSSSGWAYTIYFNEGNSSYPLGTKISIDGTSCASPAFAGSLGVVEQELFASVTPNSTRSNVRLGRLQDFLYKNGGNSSVFYDITSGSTVGNIPGFSPTVAASPAAGWDLATGWGSVNFAGLYSALLAAGY
jgi:subtilase family serine protease